MLKDLLKAIKKLKIEDKNIILKKIHDKYTFEDKTTKEIKKILGIEEIDKNKKNKGSNFKNGIIYIIVSFIFVILSTISMTYTYKKIKWNNKKIEENKFILVEKGSNYAGKINYDYYISKHEITQKEYKKIMGYNPAHKYGVGDNYPVYNVNWYDAVEYCNKRSEEEGLEKVYIIDKLNKDMENKNKDDNIKWKVKVDRNKNGYRLPTELEWEYAARGGNKSAGYKYSGSNNLSEVAEYMDNNGKITKPVKGKLENELGIYDMSGNVCEWCWEWYDNWTVYFKKNRYRKIKGGSFYDDKKELIVGEKQYKSPNYSDEKIGFRIIKNSK